MIDKKTPPVDAKKVQAAFALLLDRVEKKLAKASTVESLKAPVEGLTNNKGLNFNNDKDVVDEVVKTENPKGHVKSSLINKNWSVNEDELAKDPKQSTNQALPGNFSVDEKETKEEAVKLDKGDKESLGKVKKYYASLSESPATESTVSMDKKSSETEKMLRIALAKAEAEKKALLEEKEKSMIADKVHSIVSKLESKGLLSKESEDEMIDVLSEMPKDVISKLGKAFDLLSASSSSKGEDKEGEEYPIPQLELDEEPMPKVETLDRISELLSNADIKEIRNKISL